MIRGTTYIAVASKTQAPGHPSPDSHYRLQPEVEGLSSRWRKLDAELWSMMRLRTIENQSAPYSRMGGSGVGVDGRKERIWQLDGNFTFQALLSGTI